MKTIICPHCHKEIKTNLSETYYSRHREELLAKYKEQMKNPAFRKRRNEISLKSYRKKKQCQ
jgi:hypothetical protein